MSEKSKAQDPNYKEGLEPFGYIFSNKNIFKGLAIGSKKRRRSPSQESSSSSDESNHRHTISKGNKTNSGRKGKLSS
jgi:hypothetical protein